MVLKNVRWDAVSDGDNDSYNCVKKQMAVPQFGGALFYGTVWGESQDSQYNNTSTASLKARRPQQMHTEPSWGGNQLLRLKNKHRASIQANHRGEEEEDEKEEEGEEKEKE